MKFIDLFAGIGGIRLPFDELGYKCVFSSEWDKHAQETYNYNFLEIPYGDITKIDPKDIPSHDIILAGFPCQPFSMAGKQLGFNDTRGTLFFNIAQIAEYHKPRVLLLENVKRLKSHDGGKTFAVIINALKELGYNIFSQVLNAKDFGVPQNRERIYIVAIRDLDKFEFPIPPKVKTKVGDILEKGVSKKYTISNKLWAGHQRRKKKHAKNGNGFGYSIFGVNDKHTSTISARYYKDGSEILIKKKGKSNPRKLTPREAARLQGFPETFIIHPSDTQAYKQFGNSVAVPVIRALALQIDKTLKEADIIKNIIKQENIDVQSIPQIP